MDTSPLPDCAMPTAISRRPRLTRWHAAISSGPYSRSRHASPTHSTGGPSATFPFEEASLAR